MKTCWQNHCNMLSMWFFGFLPHFFNTFNLDNLQVAYERLLINDRVPAFPLVPIVYTVYRFKQLARGMEIVNAMGGGFSLAFTIRLLMVVWTFYLGLRLTQLPWLYSTWNSNRATWVLSGSLYICPHLGNLGEGQATCKSGSRFLWNGECLPLGCNLPFLEGIKICE